MKKFITVLLLAVIYSGDRGHLMYISKEQPRFIHDGRWLHFTTENGDEIDISGSSTIVIRKTEI